MYEVQKRGNPSRRKKRIKNRYAIKQLFLKNFNFVLALLFLPVFRFQNLDRGGKGYLERIDLMAIPEVIIFLFLLTCLCGSKSVFLLFNY